MINMTVVDENKEVSLTATKEVIEAVIDIKSDEDLVIDQLLELNHMCIAYNRNTNIIHQITIIEGEKLSKSADDVKKVDFQEIYQLKPVSCLPYAVHILLDFWMFC